MKKQLYKLMNWPRIESILYSDGDRPDLLLGPHDVQGGVLIQCFFPEINGVSVILDDKRVPMELADEDGFYAAFLPDRKAKGLRYHFELTKKDGTKAVKEDSYRFPALLLEEDVKALAAGTDYEIYRRLGAHPVQCDGVDGTFFAVYAPNAARVSVIGDFNDWDGRVSQMCRYRDSGIFELFIPGAGEGDAYQYEIKARSGKTHRRSDPFALEKGASPVGASVIRSLAVFSFAHDLPANSADEPLSVYQFDPAAFTSFAEAKAALPAYVKKMHFNAVCFRPASGDGSAPYAPDSRFGTPGDLMELVDAFHEKEIRVIFEWNPVSFARGENSPESFDFEPLFESGDPKNQATPDGRRFYFDIASKPVSNYLIANAFYWIRTYHADGIKTDDLAPMLYLDYGKQETGFTPNMYGDARNLAAVEFLRHLNSMMHKLFPDVCMIAEETAAWPGVTDAVEADGLGFTWKLQTNFRDDLLQYIGIDPLFRQGSHNLLLDSMLYQYRENYILPLTVADFGPEGETILRKTAGASEEDKFADIRLLLSYLMVHPGPKFLNLGETLGDVKGKTGGKPSKVADLRKMVAKLNEFYLTMPAFCDNDREPDGFEWIRQMANEKDMLLFLRKGSHPQDFVLVAANFAGSAWKEKAGVPFAGRYVPVFDSAKESGEIRGEGSGKEKEGLVAVREGCDGRSHSVEMDIAPLSLKIFKYAVK